MNPLDQIDSVLLSFNPKESIEVSNIYVRIKEKKIIIDVVRLNEILHKLIKDGYLRIVVVKGATLGVNMDDISYYVLTFEGEFFQYTGGYSEEKKVSDDRATWTDSLLVNGEQNQRRLNTLTFWLCVGTIGLVLFEITKFVLQHYCFVCHSF